MDYIIPANMTGMGWWTLYLGMWAVGLRDDARFDWLMALAADVLQVILTTLIVLSVWFCLTLWRGGTGTSRAPRRRPRRTRAWTR